MQNNDIGQVVAYDGNLSYDVVNGEYIPRKSKFPYSFPSYSLKGSYSLARVRVFGEGEVISTLGSDGEIIVDY